MRAGRREGLGWWRHTSGMHGEEKARLKAWEPRARAERTPNMTYMVVTLEGVEAQRLVEGRRVLPSQREGMRCGGGEVRAGRREGLGWWRHTRGMHGGKARLKAWGPRARAERTLNM